MHPLNPHSPFVRRRTLMAVFGILTLFVLAAAPVSAAEPLDARDPGPMPRRTAPPSPTAEPTTSPGRPATPTSLGLDVSWPQCNDELPTEFAFAIVGVDGGRVHKANACLEAQLAWAGRDADLYINTANPGPEHSTFWPAGEDGERACDTRAKPGADTRDCAYLYGWNAAADSYARALAAYVELGWADADAEELPAQITWWLDVETANSWRRQRDLNVASLEGAADYLASMGAAEVGFYSTPLLWWRVTGGTDEFAGHPSWHAGAHSHDEAIARCDHEAFTGGELRIVQWIQDGIDTNYRCP